MLYLRISLMVPLPSEVNEAVRLLDEVTNFCNGHPGYLGAYVLQQQPETGIIGRVTLWEDEKSATAVAQTAHMLALRSGLNRLLVVGSHKEFGFIAERAPVTRRDSGLSTDDALAAAEQIIWGSEPEARPGQ